MNHKHYPERFQPYAPIGNPWWAKPISDRKRVWRINRHPKKYYRWNPYKGEMTIWREN